MAIEIVLNELSTFTARLSSDQGKAAMSNLIKVMRNAIKRGACNTLRTEYNVKSINIADGYSIGAWLADRTVLLEERQFFLSISAKSPYLRDLDTLFIEEDLDRVEYFFQGTIAKGIGYAYMLEGLAVSLDDASGSWNESLLEIDEYKVDEHGQDFTRQVLAKHAMNYSHIIALEDWIRHRAQTDVIRGGSIWEERATIFPNLIFCSCVKEQLESFQPGDPGIRNIYKKLKELDEHSSQWVQGAFDATNLVNTSPESTSRIQQYEDQMTFRCPDGRELLFHWHRRYTPGCGRIHFYPEENQKEIYVGYIGTKIGA